jgi:hypothetical protein
LSFLHCAIINLKFFWLFSWLREFFYNFYVIQIVTVSR